MAELHIASGWIVPDSLAILLRDTLPDEYAVVSEPTIHSCELDMVVVGPPGLFVLHLSNGPAADGQIAKPDAAPAAAALRGFLKDEFPALSPSFYHLLVVTDPRSSLVTTVPPTPPELPAIKPEDVADYITGIEPPHGDVALPHDTVRELALALRDRKLTVSQRAKEPFVFPADPPTAATKVWTIREVVDYIGRHPISGLRHLRDGSLISWLSTQGALHLAQLARELFVGRPGQDPRAAMERFLLATRLVTPSGLSIEPTRIRLGYLTPGQRIAHQLRLRRTGPRGYLFGTLKPDVPWIDVEPGAYSGEQQVDATVTVDTTELEVARTAYTGHVEITSEGSGESFRVPVECVVTAAPSENARRLLRPATGALAAGLLGLAVGGLFGALRTPGPQAAIQLAPLSLSPSLAWGLAIGLCWAVLGAARGATQRPAWPTVYALRRWLTRTAVWAVLLFVAAGAGFTLWQSALQPLGQAFPASARLTFAVWAAALAVVPSVWGEMRAARLPNVIPAASHERVRLRRPQAAALAVVLAAMLLVGGGLLYPVTTGAAQRQASVEQWMVTRSNALAEGLSDMVERLTVYYYDRRAPVKPTPTPPATAPEAAHR